MTIAELFVKLGIKGGTETKREIQGVTGALTDVSGAGLQAKAMILGVVYGLKQMMSHSAATGQSMKDFATLTGMSTTTLQKWQHAMVKVGGDAKEVEQNMKGVQSMITGMGMDGNAPQSWGYFSATLSEDDLLRMVDDTEFAMLKIQDYAQKMSPAIGRKLMGDLNISEGMQVAMRRNAFTPEGFAGAQIQSEKMLAKNAAVGVKWEQMARKAEFLMAKLVSKHGDQMITDIGKVASEIFTLVDALSTLAEKMKIFEIFSTVLKGWSELIGMINEKDDGKPKDPNEKGWGDYIKHLIVGDGENDPYAGDLIKNGSKPKVGRTPQSLTTVNENKPNVVMNFTDRADVQKVIRDTNSGFAKFFTESNAALQEN